MNEFKDVLFNKKIIKHKIKRIQAKKHKIGTYEINKISLSCFDDKRQVLDDGVHTLAYFHFHKVVKKIVSIKKKILSSIVNEAIGQLFFYKDILHKKKHTSFV